MDKVSTFINHPRPIVFDGDKNKSKDISEIEILINVRKKNKSWNVGTKAQQSGLQSKWYSRKDQGKDTACMKDRKGDVVYIRLSDLFCFLSLTLLMHGSGQLIDYENRDSPGLDAYYIILQLEKI